MDLKVNATIHLKPDDVKQIITEYIESKTGRKVSNIDIKVHSATDDRFHYSPAGLTAIDVEIKV